MRQSAYDAGWKSDGIQYVKKLTAFCENAVNFLQKCRYKLCEDLKCVTIHLIERL